MLFRSEQHSDGPTDAAIIMREEYAKAALILFYPFRSNDLFNTDFDDGLWSKFLRVKSDSKFCALGLEILQNMHDNIQSRKCKSPNDELTTTNLYLQKTSSQMIMFMMMRKVNLDMRMLTLLMNTTVKSLLNMVL